MFFFKKKKKIKIGVEFSFGSFVGHTGGGLGRTGESGRAIGYGHVSPIRIPQLNETEAKLLLEVDSQLPSCPVGCFLFFLSFLLGRVSL